MENIINERKNDINAIAAIMGDINELAKDIAKETSIQGENLLKVDESMNEAKDNAEAGLQELQEAQVHSRRTGKCTYFLVGIIMLCLVVLGIFLASSGQ